MSEAIGSQPACVPEKSLQTRILRAYRRESFELTALCSERTHAPPTSTLPPVANQTAGARRDKVHPPLTHFRYPPPSRADAPEAEGGTVFIHFALTNPNRAPKALAACCSKAGGRCGLRSRSRRRGLAPPPRPGPAVRPRAAAEEPEEEDKRSTATAPAENCWGSVNKRRL